MPIDLAMTKLNGMEVIGSVNSWSRNNWQSKNNKALDVFVVLACHKP